MILINHDIQCSRTVEAHHIKLVRSTKTQKKQYQHTLAMMRNATYHVTDNTNPRNVTVTKPTKAKSTRKHNDSETLAPSGGEGSAVEWDKTKQLSKKKATAATTPGGKSKKTTTSRDRVYAAGGGRGEGDRKKRSTAPKKCRSMPKMPSMIASKIGQMMSSKTTSTDDSQLNLKTANEGWSNLKTSKPSSSNRRPKAKGVKICEPRNEVYKVVPRASKLTPEDKKKLWFHDDDYQRMQYDCMKTVHKMEQGKELRDKKYSTTGLEHCTVSGQEERYYNKGWGWKVVMDEQAYKWEQRELGHRCSSTEMSVAYEQVSQHAKAKAYTTAQTIQEDVEQYLLKDDSSFLMLLESSVRSTQSA